MALRLTARQVKMDIRVLRGRALWCHSRIAHKTVSRQISLEAYTKRIVQGKVQPHQSCKHEPIRASRGSFAQHFPSDLSSGPGSIEGQKSGMKKKKKNRYPLCIGWRFGWMGQGK